MTIINVQNLSKHFKTLKAVDDISFSVNEGEVFGFLGPNGAGKTTTINILCTLLSPSSGSAEIAGYDCAKHPDQVRAAIGLIFQDTTLDNGLTAYENLKFHAYLYNLERKLTEKRINEMLGGRRAAKPQKRSYQEFFRRHEAAARDRPGPAPLPPRSVPGRADPRP